MSTINVTCQHCHKRFNVSEKFAGKSGPCPSCKSTINIPNKGDEVVIHAPTATGPVDSTGQAVLKPIERADVEASPVVVVGIIGAIIVSILVAIVLRMQFPQPPAATSVEPAALWWILFGGAVVLAPPLVLAGYWFLRDDELEPHRGGELVLRACICAAIYAALWGAYAMLRAKVFPNAPPEMFQFLFIGPAFLGAGGVAGLATLDLEFGNGAIHYAFYLLVTVLFCFIIGVPVF
jgi:hypothetical protein